MKHISDFLVIGSGAAGLSFALRAAERGTVTILTKKERAESNTNYAQGGIAAVFDKADSFESHIEDTMIGGVGLCYKDAVKAVVVNGPDRIKDLVKWGVKFTEDANKHQFDLIREGGHSNKRIVHVMDKTGMAVENALLECVKNHPKIEVMENSSAVELITEHHLGKNDQSNDPNVHCWGAYALDGESGNVNVYLSKVTLIASGGAGHVYLHTSNPLIATGDGIAMAYRAGADIANMEFIQFHPTTLYHPDGDSFLISEAVRGYGGVLINRAGRRFMENLHPRKELAPRDVVARAIDSEIKKSGDACVFLDITHVNADDVRRRFPQINEKLSTFKIDMTKEPVPVVPAAHYTCGGILTDTSGRTRIGGLYATGEAACTGVHGANRLASNSLLEALVFSELAFRNASEYMESNNVNVPEIPEWQDTSVFDPEEWVLVSHDRHEIQRLMWDYVGIVRSDERLARAGERIDLIKRQIESFYKKTPVRAPLLELRNLATVAALIIRSAIFRKESRGLHFTTDYPDKDDKNWLGNTIISRGQILLKSLSDSFSF